MSNSEAKAILRINFWTEWRQRLDTGTEEDRIHQLDRVAQVTIFRLKTGHSQLFSHLHRLKSSHSDEYPCGTGPQIPQTHPAPSTLWDARHGRVRWMPTGSFGKGRDTAADLALLTGLKNAFYSCGHPARRLALQGLCQDWLARCQYVNIPWLDDITNSICNVFASVAARTIVRADPSPRYINMLLRC